MRKLFFLVIPTITLVGLVVIGLGDTTTSIADTEIPDNEITTSQTEASNYSASATITITMYAVHDKWSSERIWRVPSQNWEGGQ